MSKNLHGAPDQKQLKIAGFKISFMMALVMSLCLSVVGNLTARRPEGTPAIAIISGILFSFVISFVISLIIGLLIPIRRITSFILKKMELEEGKFETRLIESLISDIIYTPVITLVMTGLAYNSAMKASNGLAQLDYSTMFLGSLGICMIAGYILIFIFQPLFIKMFIPGFKGPDKQN